MKSVSSLVSFFFLIIEKGSHANQKDLHWVIFTPRHSMAMFFEWVRKEEAEVMREGARKGGNWETYKIIVDTES